jgi:hypothetical protein
MYGPPRDCKGKVWTRRQVCANVFGLWVEINSPGHDELRGVCPLKTRRSLKTIRNNRFQARRCDCSFVVAYPKQTLVEKLQSVMVVWESGSAQRFQAEGVFSTPLG